MDITLIQSVITGLKVASDIVIGLGKSHTIAQDQFDSGTLYIDQANKPSSLVNAVQRRLEGLEDFVVLAASGGSHGL